MRSTLDKGFVGLGRRVVRLYGGVGSIRVSEPDQSGQLSVPLINRASVGRMNSEFYTDGDDVVVPTAVEFDVSTAADMLKVTETALAAGTSAKRLIIDMSATSFLDSSGLGALVSMLNAANGRGIPMQLRNLRPQLRRLLEMTGLLSVFDVTP